MPSTIYDRVDCHFNDRRKFLFLYFFATFSKPIISSFLISSSERCDIRRIKTLRTQLCRFPSSLAPLNFLASRSRDLWMNKLPQRILCSSLNFCWLWKHGRRFHEKKKKRPRLNIIAPLLTQVKRKKRPNERKENEESWMQRKKTKESVRRKTIKLNEYAFTDFGARNKHVESLQKKRKCSARACPDVFPPLTKRNLKFADKLVKSQL